MFEEELQRQIDAFMEKHGMSPTTFGLWAMNDSRFVFDLRSGRVCFGRTIRRLFAFMREYDAKRGGQPNLVSPPPAATVRKRAESLRLASTVIGEE